MWYERQPVKCRKIREDLESNKKTKVKGIKLNTRFTALVILVVLFPIAILAGIIYYNMEKNVIDENLTYMEYIMERDVARISINVDAIRMSTQLVLSNNAMLDVLNAAYENRELSTAELLDFYDRDIATLERLVNNTPLLYGVRVYAASDNVQELMPVLYKNSRMKNLSWANKEEITGWQYGYDDTLFSALLTNQNSELMALVTPITDYRNGNIGVVEVVMEMQTMFPSMYDDVESEWRGFISDKGDMYFGLNQDKAKELLEKIPFEVMSEQDDGKIYTKYLEIDGGKYVISYANSSLLKGSLISVRDITESVAAIMHSRNTFIIMAIFLLIFLTFFVNMIVNRMLKSFYNILRSIRQVQNGDLDVKIPVEGNDEMGELAIQLNTMLDRIRKLMKDNLDRELLAKNSEIRALQNQINAHFIYNVLETIKMMAEIDEEYAISDAITSLGKLLRYSMKWVSGNVSIRDELEYIRNYVALINLRFDYEIILSVNIPDRLLGQEIPKMSLQPIVENAILHGIEEVAQDTTIYIKGYIRGEDCAIEVTDSGKGMSESQVEAIKEKIAGKIENEGGSGNGIGLKNVQDRITMAFGREYGLDVASKLNCYTKIIVHLPYIPKGKITL